MKTIRWTAVFLLPALGIFSEVFYVGPNGCDKNPGLVGAPFQTLEAARDAARKNPGPDTVVLQPGRYPLTSTFELNSADTRTTFTAKAPGTVFIDGGRIIDNTKCTPVKGLIVTRFPKEARGKIMQINLRQLGITEYGEIGPRGFGRSYKTAPLELFVDGEPMQTSRWPNEGRIQMGKIIDPGSAPRFGDFSFRGGTFKYETDRAERWAKAKDLYVTGIFAHGYADDTIKVEKLDLKKGTIKLTHPHLYGLGGHKGNQPKLYTWAALNLIEEIDMPGEYAVDRDSGILYFYPTKDVSHSTFQVSLMEEPLVAVEGAQGIVFENITFENARGMAVYMEGGDSNCFKGCTFRNLGLMAIQMGKGAQSPPDGLHSAHGKNKEGYEWKVVSRRPGNIHTYSYFNTAWNRECGTNHEILSCNIYNCGAGGIILGGGDRKTLTPGNNAVKNCDIHHVNRWEKIYKTPVNIFGVGNKILNNHLHDCPGQGVLLHGNDHLLEYNVFGRLVQDASDQAAIYMGRDPSEAGNIFRHNFFHDIYCGHEGGWGVQAIFFDDYSVCSATVEGNVFYKAGSTSVIKYYHGGNSYIYNNIMIDCPRGMNPLHATTKGLRKFFSEELMQKRLTQAVNILEPPYSDKYPDLVKLYKGEKELEWPYERNYEVKGDYSQFVDPDHMNFKLKADSSVFTDIKGFKPIPFEKIGLYKDEYRRSH